MEYFNTSSNSPWRRSEACLRPSLLLRWRTTSPLVFHPQCLTCLAFCLGVTGKHCKSSEHESCGVVIHHRKMRPLTGSGGKKKHTRHSAHRPPPVRNAHTANRFLVGVRHILVLLSLTPDPWHIWKRSWMQT